MNRTSAPLVQRRDPERARRCLALAVTSWALAVVSCGAPDPWQRPTEVLAEPSSDIETVVRVSWRTDTPSVGYVEYGETPSREWSTPLEGEPSRSHSQLVLGLREDTTYSLRVVTWDGREAGASEIQSVRTGRAPSEVPVFDQTGAGLEGFVVLPLRGPHPGVVIVDEAGQVVWYHRDRSGLDPLRARLSADATSVIYNRVSVEEASSEDSALVRVPLDGSEPTIIPVPFLAHDFLELPDGELAALVVDRLADDTRGDSIVEIDSGGDVTQVWSASDCFDPSQAPGDDATGAWTYANALDYVHSSTDPSAQAYYVGLRGFSSIVKVLRESGECAWVLGTTAATLALATGDTPFVHQSGFDAYSNRVLVMDNGLEADVSRVVEYELDPEAGTAGERASYSEPTGSSVGELGGVTRLVDGQWLINWASLGRLELVDDGDSRWQLSAEDASFGYHMLVDTLYATTGRRP